MELLPGFLQLGLERIINKDVARRNHRARAPGKRIFTDAKLRIPVVKGKTVTFILIHRIQVNDHLVRSGKFNGMLHLTL